MTDQTSDPRTAQADDTLRGIIAGIGGAFAGIAKATGHRATHGPGVAARGRLTVLSNPDIPNHRYFKAGASYPAVVRHASIKGMPDDAVRDGRGLTLRLLNGDACAATSDLNLNDGFLDVLSSTGPCFFLNNAADFARWVASDMDGRKAMLDEFPKITPIFCEIVKNPDSFTQLHYYSEVTYQFIAEDGVHYLMRYRILNADKSADTGFVPPEDNLLPQDYIPRPEGDTRSETYLRDDFAARVQAGNGVYYLLQMQLRPLSADHAENEAAKDCTTPWDEATYPMRDVALIHLNEVVPEDMIEPVGFSPYNAPPELGLILGHTATEMASINHLRSVVYTWSYHMRRGLPLPEFIQQLIS